MYMTSKNTLRFNKNKHSKHPKSRKNSRSRKHKKHQKKVYFIGGQCSSCGTNLMMSGGTCAKRIGGGNDASFHDSIPIRYYYGLNNYDKDPSHKPFIASTRIMPNIKGGKTIKKQSKKGGAGALGYSFTNAQYGPVPSFNAANSIGTLPGASIGANILSGNVDYTVLPNPSILSQPVNDKYNINNLPMA